MTPPNGNEEFRVSKAEKEAHMFECWNKQGGPGWEVNQKVDKVRMWVAGASVLAMVLNGMGLVVLAWWLSTRLPAQQHGASDAPSLIKSAHAETKGSP